MPMRNWQFQLCHVVSDSSLCLTPTQTHAHAVLCDVCGFDSAQQWSLHMSLFQVCVATMQLHRYTSDIHSCAHKQHHDHVIVIVLQQEATKQKAGRDRRCWTIQQTGTRSVHACGVPTRVAVSTLPIVIHGAMCRRITKVDQQLGAGPPRQLQYCLQYTSTTMNQQTLGHQEGR